MAGFVVNTEMNITVSCPYCGQTFELLIEPGLGAQDLITDCEVCCRPLRVSVTGDPDEPASSEPA